MMLAKEGTYQLPIDIPELQIYHYNQAFPLERGGELGELHIGYHTYGHLNEARDNVIWVCHALTANSAVSDWWKGLFGEGSILDPTRYFIVCANILGSCYGTTCPRSIDPKSGEAYGLDFPMITIRDMALANDLLRQHLGIERIALSIGGSCGGYQVLEHALLQPDLIQRMGLLVTSAKETPWSIAIHEAGRMALESDDTFVENSDKAGARGLKGARAVGLLGYRTIDAYLLTQSDKDDRYDDFKASSYIRYQGEKLERRFYAHCYWHLLKALDTHHLGRNRNSVEAALASIDIPALVIGIDTDMLIPTSQQRFLAKHLPQSQYHEIHSDFGHDGFLVESPSIDKLFMEWMYS